MSSAGQKSNSNSKNTKRKHNSPTEIETKTTRRRFLSSSLPDLSTANDFGGQLKKMEGNSESSDHTGTNTCNNPSLIDPSNPATISDVNLTPQTPLIQTEGQTYSLPGLIISSMCDTSFMNQLVPILANAIAPTVQKAVQSAFQELTNTIKEQAEEINELKKQVSETKEANSDLQKQIWNLEESLDDLEQYGRRNSLRFHNCPVPNDDQNTDGIVINLCKSKLNIDLTEEDIFRSHPIGKPNKNGNYQIICRFSNWKVKNKVYSEKRKLKNTSVFMTEDLTRYRQSIVQELTKAKRARSVHSFWTNDGRIFVKVYERGPKQLIRSFSDLDRIAQG